MAFCRTYLQVLQKGDDYDHVVSRVVKLWMDHREDDATDSVMKANLERTPSYKFLLLVRQLVPHLCAKNSPFSKKVRLELEETRCYFKYFPVEGVEMIVIIVQI